MTNNDIKLAILGMENAGKSTIIDLLIKNVETPLGTLPNMNPTKSVHINQFQLNDKQLIVWDFGGQEIYRSDYMDNPDKYFKAISYLYYVIDSQDYYRVLSSVMYFLGISRVIKKMSPDVKIIFIFHKMDPDFDPSLKKVKEKFLENVGDNLRANNIQFEWFDTSIYDLDSIKKAFNQI